NSCCTPAPRSHAAQRGGGGGPSAAAVGIPAPTRRSTMPTSRAGPPMRRSIQGRRGTAASAHVLRRRQPTPSTTSVGTPEKNLHADRVTIWVILQAEVLSVLLELLEVSLRRCRLR